MATHSMAFEAEWPRGPSAQLDERLAVAERRLGRAARWSLLWLTVLLPLPAVIAGADPRYLLVPLALAGAIVGVAAAEPKSSRRLIAYFGIIGFALGWTILLALVWIQRAAGFVVLGPDGVEFLLAAQTIVSQGFALPEPAHVYFKILSTGHYYLFAGLLYLLGPSLLNLQAFHCAATALLGPLTFAWTRAVYPQGALPAGVLVTLFPSIVYLSAIDLWKDPSVILATTVAIWALVHICRDARAVRLFVFVPVAGACLWYLHISRFYPLVYLEIGLIVAAAVALAHRRPLKKAMVTAVVAVVAIGEAGPMAFSWPNSAFMLVANVAHVLNVPSMRYYTASLLDRMETSRANSVSDRHTHKLETLEDLQVGLATPATAKHRERGRTSMPARQPSRVLQVDVDQSLATSTRFGSINWMAHIIRRVYGPFVWIFPPTLTASAWLGGLYLMYPGMLFWYVMLPVMALGFVVAGWSILRGQQPFMVGVVWVYTGLYSLQYLVMNLPVRQREAMFPVLVVFGIMGYHWVRGRGWATWAYGVYWLGLIAMAVAHLVVRAQLAA